MINHGPVRRYARALYAVARDSNQVAQVAESMALLLQTLRAHPRLARYLGDQRQPGDVRCAVIGELLQASAHALVKRFCALLVAKRRLGMLSAIAVEFASLNDDGLGIAHADVVAAHPLDDGMAAMIVAAVTPAGARELRLSVNVDADLLAGARIRIGDTVYDASLAARLRQAGRRLASAGRGNL